MDRWDGYVTARERLTRHLGREQVSNPIILTGDIHSNWVADVKESFQDPESASVAAEFVGTSISSGGDGRDSAEALPAIQRLNPHIHHFDARRGYVALEVGTDTLTANYRRVPFVTEPGAPVETAARFVVEDGVRGTRRA
ncbi:MAG: alkaline phosphatase D family protein [Gemmatimonadota bacterium]|nr:alkaline phosphatase D family protein [Gemmatimonadota bacterium]